MRALRACRNHARHADTKTGAGKLSVTNSKGEPVQMEETSGGCLCAAVTLRASGRPNRVGLCHCLDCRKHHGALFGASAIFPVEAVSINGQTESYRGRHFCPLCGSSIFARSGDEIEVHLGTLDAANRYSPTYELWTSRREAWLPPFTQLRHFEHDRDEEIRSES